MQYDNSILTIILNKLNYVAYHLLFLVIIPIILLVLITREIVVDLKNKLFTLNLKRQYNVKKASKHANE
jgi:hypothetical protein